MNNFNENEVREIIRVFPKKGWQGCELCRQNHTAEDIADKAMTLGVVKDIDTDKKPKQKRTKNNFSNREIQEIIKNYQMQGLKGCPLCRLKHSDNSIMAKANAMGIRKIVRENHLPNAAWSKSEYDLLVKFYPKGGPELCIAKGLNRTLKAIHIKAHLLEIKRKRHKKKLKNHKPRLIQRLALFILKRTGYNYTQPKED